MPTGKVLPPFGARWPRPMASEQAAGPCKGIKVLAQLSGGRPTSASAVFADTAAQIGRIEKLALQIARDAVDQTGTEFAVMR